MKKTLWLIGIALCLYNTSHAQFYLESEGNKSVEEQYKSWLSTTEAPTNELNFELKPQEEQQKYNQEKEAFLKENGPPYAPEFFIEWQSIADAPINWSNFHLKSQKEQINYQNKINRWFEKFNKGFLAFNLTTLKEPFLSEDERTKEEVHIKKLLVKCSQIIGYETWEEEIKEVFTNPKYDFYEHGPLVIYWHFKYDEGLDIGFASKTRYHKLNNYAYKCINYLYLHRGMNEEAVPEYYDITDFEYDRNLTQKENAVEELYEDIYLNVKKAGLLRRFANLYYPKSFLREHADETGLTEFIKVEERQAGKKLDHEKLAIQFFETREKWLTSLNDFIAIKLTEVKSKD